MFTLGSCITKGSGATCARILRAPRGLMGALFAGALFAGATILACAPAATLAQTPQHLTQPVDLRASAAGAAAQGRVLLVLFSETGCPWCERLRREVLLPMQRNAGLQKKLAFFQVDVDSGAAVRDFSGEATTQAALSRRYGIRIMPTVLLLGPTGQPLAEPLVGYGSSDFYGAYLEERINTAQAAMAAKRAGAAR